MLLPLRMLNNQRRRLNLNDDYMMIMRIIRHLNIDILISDKVFIDKI